MWGFFHNVKSICILINKPLGEVMIKLKQLDGTGTQPGDVLVGGPDFEWSSGSSRKILLSGILSQPGSASSPSISFRDSNTGMYLISGGKMGFSTSGTLRAFLNTVSFTSYVPVRLQGGSGPVLTFEQDTDTGLGTLGTGQMSLWVDGEVKVTYTGSATMMYGAFVLPVGTTQERTEDVGSIRLNSDMDVFEGRTASGWVGLSGPTFNRVVVTTSYTVTGGEDYLGVRATEDITITLPPGAMNKRLTVKDESGSASTNVITIVGQDCVIDGQGSFVLNVDYAAISLLYGDEWYVY